jgi:hypothetical protein
VVAAFVFSKNRIASLKLIGIFAVCFTAFILFSEAEFHELIPFYYNPALLEANKVISFVQWLAGGVWIAFEP